MPVTAVAIQEGTFAYNGRVYPYLNDSYNETRINERAVEVPIALHLLNEARHPLEIGAVLPHYLPDWPDRGHMVIDLHEQYPGVINEDVLDYRPMIYHDLIICISTLDHLGSADDVKTAVRRMKSWLTVGGRLFVTLPYGQPSEVGGGEWLDDLVLSGGLDMVIRRMDKIHPQRHGWHECPLDAPLLDYHGRSSFANTLFILEWER